MLKIEVLDGEVRVVQDGKGLVDSMPLTSGAEQFAAVIEAMKRANPGFDGAMIPGLENGRLVSLDFKTGNVTDISPLRELKHLRMLQMVGSFEPDKGISDLSPLKGLPLTELHISSNLRVTDLSPLKGMALQKLNAMGCRVTDFTSLAGMPLRELWAWYWAGSDLSPLKGMPLTQLNIGGNGREMDLTPLAGAPLEFICLNSSNVSDLSPLKGMPLRVLLSENTLVSDLSPIRDAKLIEFAGDSSRISNISVLQGMPITNFHCDVLGQRELELLRGCNSLKSINF